MRVLALSPQSISEALAGAALQSCLRRFLVSMETTQPGLEPCQTQHSTGSSATVIRTLRFKEGAFRSYVSLHKTGENIHGETRFFITLLM